MALTDIPATLMFRRGRARPGHPHLAAARGKDVDARVKLAHDEMGSEESEPALQQFDSLAC
jgi:hypothetical protein